MPMESSSRPHSSNQFAFSLFRCQQTQSKEPTATSTTMATGLKGGEIGASVVSGKKLDSRVTVQPLKKEEKAPPLLDLTSESATFAQRSKQLQLHKVAHRSICVTGMARVWNAPLQWLIMFDSSVMPNKSKLFPKKMRRKKSNPLSFGNKQKAFAILQDAAEQPKPARFKIFESTQELFFIWGVRKRATQE